MKKVGKLIYQSGIPHGLKCGKKKFNEKCTVLK